MRRWSVEAGRALLNGRPLDLRGASLHEQTAAHGAALTPADRRRLVKELTSLGATFTRAHYPLHPALLEAFDRLGIVVWDQVPVWRLSGRELAGPLRARALGDLDALVRRDRNHASVMAWSVENETLRGGSAEARYLAAAAALVRRLDATRLVAADVPLRPLDAVPGALRGLDAIGINDYVGWYGGSLPGDLLADLRRLRARFPRRRCSSPSSAPRPTGVVPPRARARTRSRPGSCAARSTPSRAAACSAARSSGRCATSRSGPVGTAATRARIRRSTRRACSASTAREAGEPARRVRGSRPTR